MGRRLKSTARKILIRAALFLAYLFVGAGVFLAIERTGEYEGLLDEYNSRQHKFKLKHNITDTEMSNFMKITEQALRGGYFTFSKTSEWSFVNAFFFSGNIVTTIGYGHIVPRSPAGRIVCMVYALIGIPLTAFFLRTVGNELTSFIFNSVKSYERRAYNREAERLEMKSAVITCILALIMLFLGGMIFSLTEKWTYLDAFYFCFVSLTTIGFGDFIPGSSRVGLGAGESLSIELAALIYYVVGLSIMSGVILSISKLIEEKTKKLDMYDPLDAIANMNIENLNDKALTKLGYKMPQATADMLARRGTIIPGGNTIGAFPRRPSATPDCVESPAAKCSSTMNGINSKLRNQSRGSYNNNLDSNGHTCNGVNASSRTKPTNEFGNRHDTTCPACRGQRIEEEEEVFDKVDMDNESTSASNSVRGNSLDSISIGKDILRQDSERSRRPSSPLGSMQSLGLNEIVRKDLNAVTHPTKRPKSSPLSTSRVRRQSLKISKSRSASNLHEKKLEEPEQASVSRAFSWRRRSRVYPSDEQEASDSNIVPEPDPDEAPPQTEITIDNEADVPKKSLETDDDVKKLEPGEAGVEIGTSDT